MLGQHKQQAPRGLAQLVLGPGEQGLPGRAAPQGARAGGRWGNGGRRGGGRRCRRGRRRQVARAAVQAGTGCPRQARASGGARKRQTTSLEERGLPVPAATLPALALDAVVCPIAEYDAAASFSIPFKLLSFR